VDDNLYTLNIFHACKDHIIMTNDISQTFDIRMSDSALESIYTCFHFPPRVDFKDINKKKRIIKYETNQYNNLSKHLLFKALKTEDPYLIGIACHVYQDSFAHNGFSGKNDVKNTPFKLPFKLNFGHAYYGSYPDMIGVKWKNHHNSKLRDNNKAFINAAISLYNIFSSHLKSRKFSTEYRKYRLKDALGKTFGKAVYPFANLLLDRQDARINEYTKLAHEWFQNEIPQYDKDAWLSDAAFFDIKDLRWTAKNNFENSDWLQFQKGVKLYKTMHQEIVNYDKKDK
ncbi:MAG: DUF6765 family protein, partial [Alphaproteobacteria bacterium]